MKRFVFFIFVLCMVVGCANTDASLRRESARVIGGLTPDQVTVSNVDRGIMNVDWTAVTSDGTTYKCSSDDMLRRPNCVKK